MKLLSSPDTARRAMRGEDGLSRGIEAALTLLLLFGVGYASDRWLGTTPVLTIVGSVVAIVGLFCAWMSRYTAQMDELEARRRDDASRHRQTGSGASERAPAPPAWPNAVTERPATACVAGERNEGSHR